VDVEHYAVQVQNVGLFLEGRHDELLAELQASMQRASDEQRYEEAAIHRDQIRAVESARETQRVSLVSDVDQDVFGLFVQGDKAEVAVLMARRGRVTGVRTFALRELRLPDEEIVASFVGEYYRRGSFVPHEVVLPTRIEAAQGLEDVLSEQRGSRVKLLRPQRGHKAALLRMASENAAHAFREKARASEDMDARLDVIQERLDLRVRPERIECIDISHHGGGDTVAVMVAFAHGEPDRARYKSFRVRGVVAGDDYAAIAEVLRRRLRRRDQDGWSLPDLLVIDGGKGQLGIARRALRELEIDGLDVVGLAKERLNVLEETLVDRVYVPGRKNAVPVGDARDPLRILGLARDEAHRASNALRIKVGARRRLRSGLDDVAGVGPRTSAKLLRALGSLQAVRDADEAALLQAGASRRQAAAILKHFGDDAVTDEPRASEDSEASAAEQGESEEQAVDNAFID
jgi:excinuclease ABC subunit C